MSAIPRNLLIFRTGQLGDTIAAVPAMRAVREHFAQARISLLCDGHPNRNYVSASDVVCGAGLVDAVLAYPVDASRLGRFLRPVRMAALLARLRAGGFDGLVYLSQSRRRPEQVRRDVRFFRMAGIDRFFGAEGFYTLPRKTEGEPLPMVPKETDLILARLAESRIPVPGPGLAEFDLRIGAEEEVAVDRWAATMPPDGGRRWLAVAPGSKMPAKRWPVERYGEVVARLIEEFDVWPVVFGGGADAPVGKSLLSRWQRGYLAAGALGIRESIAAMGRSALYLGNDSGAMHMAVVAGLRCVALFTARDYPGNWEPYGTGHVVFRKWVPCENCMLDACIENEMVCIRSVSVEEVHQACRELLGEDR